MSGWRVPSAARGGATQGAQDFVPRESVEGPIVVPDAGQQGALPGDAGALAWRGRLTDPGTPCWM